MSVQYDQYFTPPAIALKIAGFIKLHRPTRVIDSNCGNGCLLDAAETIYPATNIYGIDVDHSIVVKLNNSRPNWIVRHGDSLCSSTWSRLGKISVDAAILNPPFSVAGRRSIVGIFNDNRITSSVAMSHVLSTIHHAKPEVLVAILPESSATSDLDRTARIEVDKSYSTEVIEKLPSSTFAGASANSIVVRMERRSIPYQTASHFLEDCPTGIDVIRGGLPVFQAQLDEDGYPYIHSIDIKILIQDISSVNLIHRVAPIQRGHVTGHVILLPRVGLPQLALVKPITLMREIQLSDCVLAIRSVTAKGVADIAKRIHDHWSEFVDLYRGTGARYITLQRLNSWLTHHYPNGI